MDFSKDLLDKVLDDYMFHMDEITVKGIIEKYELDISPSKLKSVFPLLDSESECPYCKTGMKRKIAGRGVYGIPFCETCGHKDIDETSNNQCRCKKCDEKREQMIKTVYEHRREKKKFSDLPISLKLEVGKILEKSGFKSFDVIEGRRLKENDGYDDIRKKDLIAVSPSSAIDAFVLDDTFPNRYYPYYTLFDWMVDFSDEEKEALIKGDYFSNILDDEEKVTLLKEYIHEDVMERFTELMGERGLQLEILPTAESLFRELYKELSYSEIITLCFHVARYCLDQTKTGRMYRNVAEKGALKMAITFWENDKKKGWPLAKSEVGYCGADLRWFVENVINADLSILNNIITLETINRRNEGAVNQI